MKIISPLEKMRRHGYDDEFKNNKASGNFCLPIEHFKIEVFKLVGRMHQLIFRILLAACPLVGTPVSFVLSRSAN